MNRYLATALAGLAASTAHAAITFGTQSGEVRTYINTISGRLDERFFTVPPSGGFDSPSVMSAAGSFSAQAGLNVIQTSERLSVSSGGRTTMGGGAPNSVSAVAISSYQVNFTLTATGNFALTLWGLPGGAFMSGPGGAIVSGPLPSTPQTFQLTLVAGQYSLQIDSTAVGFIDNLGSGRSGANFTSFDLQALDVPTPATTLTVGGLVALSGARRRRRTP